MSRKRERKIARRQNRSFAVRGRYDADGRLVEYSWTGAVEPDITALFQS